jgi:hypothetical protein
MLQAQAATLTSGVAVDYASACDPPYLLLAFQRRLEAAAVHHK